MCDLFFCVSGAPIPGEDDPRAGNTNTWKVRMMEAPCKQPLCCLYGFTCPCCAAISARSWVLNGDWSKYSCCQGQCKFCGLPGDNCHKGFPPQCCLCLEAWCCTGISMSSSRNYLMQEKNLMSDPCDNKIIRCNNYLQLLRCVCKILAALTDLEIIDQISDIIDIIAECFFLTVMGCMTAQLKYELTDNLPRIEYAKGAPNAEEMIQ